jgi:hypothetical protein
MKTMVFSNLYPTPKPVQKSSSLYMQTNMSSSTTTVNNLLSTINNVASSTQTSNAEVVYNMKNSMIGRLVNTKPCRGCNK